MLLEGVSWVLALAADERTSSKLPLPSDAPTFVCKKYHQIRGESIQKLDWSQITASSASAGGCSSVVDAIVLKQRYKIQSIQN